MWEVLWVKAGVGGSESRLRPRRPAVRCGSCGGWNAGCGDRTAPWRTASRADAADGAHRAAGHAAACGQQILAAREACDQVLGRAQAGQRAFLVEHLAAVFHDPRAHDQLIPVAGHVGKAPGLGGHGLDAGLLGKGHAVGFQLAVRVVGGQAHEHLAFVREHEDLDLARGVRAQHLQRAVLAQLVAGDAVVQRHGAGARDADGGQLLNVVLDGLAVAAGPAGDDEGVEFRAKVWPSGVVNCSCMAGDPGEFGAAGPGEKTRKSGCGVRRAWSGTARAGLTAS